MKKLLAVLFAGILAMVGMVSLAGCDKKTLTIGITDYEPMDYQNENGEWIGFDADLAKEFAKENGYEVKFQVIDWDSKVLEINSGNIDLIWNGMTADDELGREIDFSTAYATNMQCAVIKSSKENILNTVNAIKSAKIAVENGSAGETVSKEQLEATDVVEADSQVKALLEVASGTADVAVIDYTMAYNVVGKGGYTDLVIVDTNIFSFNKEVFAVGAKKGSDLIGKLNTFFSEKYKSGELTKLAEKYSVALNEEAFTK